MDLGPAIFHSTGGTDKVSDSNAQHTFAREQQQQQPPVVPAPSPKPAVAYSSQDAASVHTTSSSLTSSTGYGGAPNHIDRSTPDHAGVQEEQTTTSRPTAAPVDQVGTHPAADHSTLHDKPHETAVPGAVAATDSTNKDAVLGSTHPSAQAPTASIDPHKPSSESAPTALPTNPTTHPEEQKQAIKDEHPAVVHREVEKTKAEAREMKGEKPQGTVINGIEDDRLWAMLRRFDQQITHVLHPAKKLPRVEPDLRPSMLPDLPSHSEVLRSNLERLIAAVGPGSVRGAREVQRLMSWSPEERRRTGAFCIAYFTCWIFGYAMVGVFSFLVAIVCFPDCRRFFFPPIAPAPFTPPSATDPTNQKGDESLLGNVESKTVHRSKAEQAEEQAFEATSILKAYTTRLLFDGSKKGKQAGNSAVGEKERNETSSSSSSDDDEKSPPGQNDNKAQGLESAQVIVGGEKITPNKPLDEKEKKKLAQREAKRKRDEMVSKMTKGTEDGLGAAADMIERFTNALSPPAAYPDSYARFKIAGAFLIPAMFVFTFVPAWIFTRSATFFFGVGMWGQPLLIRGAKKFVELVPDWQEQLDLRNSILSRVPTDAQLTLHLLRVSEALNAPLPRPPAPPLKGTPKEAIKDTSPASMTAEDDAEMLEAEGEGGVTEAAVKAKHKTKSHILGVFKSAGKKMAAFHGDVAVDGTKKQARMEEIEKGEEELTVTEKIGSKVDQLLFKGNIKDDGSIDSYPAKLDGTSGHIILENKNDVLTQPQITFVPISGKKEHFVWAIDDIVEIKKSHVSMPRMALGWASGAEVEGLGLTIRFKTGSQQLNEHLGGPKEDGTTLHFTRVGRREQLFVRLISMGRQRWETL
ncbi:hypothetical protein CI109_101979 [Kwoniella shandongensis]|uniref:Uncharacterized protein n=1 Tax=Kwoniella shandongensis TaxID=1734106 RepID=A0A5M6BTR6_9TREE|nr:uncharacterized protein CI109_005358 [Kwoniella shandongensis]KAA5526234.1 hypothetical protein CI109_005358 [Kwoniella shandongensis]